MIDGKRILAIIPARGGSKGVPGKNLRRVGGKPLIAWAIDGARRSRFIDRLIISSDDPEIIAQTHAHGGEAPFVRPAELARDDTPSEAAVAHAIGELPGYDYVVLLQPTSPLRESGDIDGTIERCVTQGADSCISVSRAEQSPYWMYRLKSDGVIEPFIESDYLTARRQELPAVYYPNGAVFVARTDYFMRHQSFESQSAVAFEMPPERALDLDSELDFAVLEALLGQRHDARN